MDWCVNHKICILIIGHNQTWKQEVKLGKKNNEQFLNIPHNRLIEMLKYRAKLRGIKVIITEASYTSQLSFLNGDNLPEYGD
ncbi:MAG: IS200/IS605 family element transposase accessory protein TnpB [Okeania sp. SIO2F4]|nr:IS200/IS605 family element transposase accessory protein TnpB [Okeania sp. SIO2F4]